VERHRGKVARRYVQAARYTLEVDFKEYAGQLSRDIAAAAQRSPAQLGSRLAATE